MMRTAAAAWLLCLATASAVFAGEKQAPVVPQGLGLIAPLAAPMSGPAVITSLGIGAAQIGVEARAALPAQPQQLAASMLASLDAAGVDRRQAAQAVASAANVEEAFASLSALGALSAADVPQNETLREYALRRFWDGVSEPLLKERFQVDASYPIPALKVQDGARTYFIHPIAHGSLFPSNTVAVARLFRQIEGEKGTLISEEGASAHYGLALGAETNDHGAALGATPRLYRPDEARAAQTLYFRLVSTLLYLSASGAAVMQAYGSTGVVGALALASGLLALGWTVGTGSLAFYRLRERSRAWKLSREGTAPGLADMVAHFQRRATGLFAKNVQPLDALKLTLPPSPGDAHDPNLDRSRAMAAALRLAGGTQIHFLVGAFHAGRVAWELSSGKTQGPSDVAPESQIS